jgi:uncharacterized protein (DUF983 family)
MPCPAMAALRAICAVKLFTVPASVSSPTHPRVTRAQILSRGFHNRCPNCGHHSLFRPHSLRVHERCPDCGLLLDPGEGFWLGPLVLNYTLTVVLFVVPLIVLGVRGVVPLTLAIVLAVLIGGIGLPLLLYRPSWSWWLMLWFFFLPERLPANGGGRSDE